MTSFRMVLLLSLLSGCVLQVNGDKVVAEVPKVESADTRICKVDVVPSTEEHPWFAPVNSAWPLGETPTLKILKDDTHPSCTVEELSPAVDYWCEALNICMGIEYISEIPPESKYEYGSIYASKEQPPDPKDIGQAFWAPDKVCHENRFARIYVANCDPLIWAHELGHSLGFGHSGDPTDLMYHSSGPTTKLEVSSQSIAAYLVAQRAGKVASKSATP